MNDDQASRLRQMMNRSYRLSGDCDNKSAANTGATNSVQCKTIAVCSGKGGVGKSNVALNLAIRLSMAGNRVALIDADMGLANLDVLVDADVRGNLSHVVNGARTLDEIVVELPSGVQLIAGASGLVKMANLSDFQRAHLMNQLNRLEIENDYIIIDCGAGIGPNVISFAAGADSILVVTTPEPTAITDAYAVIKVLVQKNVNATMSLLVNQVESRSEAKATSQRIIDVARRFLDTRVFDAGYIKNDPKVREAVRKRHPFILQFPNCNASKCISALVHRLSAGGLMVEPKGSFFARVVKLFA